MVVVVVAVCVRGADSSSGWRPDGGGWSWRQGAGMKRKWKECRLDLPFEQYSMVEVLLRECIAFTYSFKLNMYLFEYTFKWNVPPLSIHSI